MNTYCKVFVLFAVHSDAARALSPSYGVFSLAMLLSDITFDSILSTGFRRYTAASLDSLTVLYFIVIVEINAPEDRYEKISFYERCACVLELVTMSVVLCIICRRS